METRTGEGAIKRRSFQTVENPLTGQSVGSFGISERNITRRKKKKKTHRIQAATASGEVAQMPAVPTSEQRLDREAQAA